MHRRALKKPKTLTEDSSTSECVYEVLPIICLEAAFLFNARQTNENQTYVAHKGWGWVFRCIGDGGGASPGQEQEDRPSRRRSRSSATLGRVTGEVAPGE